MRTEQLIGVEIGILDQVWPDETGKRYRNTFLLPLEETAEELRRVIEMFEQELPSRPMRRYGD